MLLRLKAIFTTLTQKKYLNLFLFSCVVIFFLLGYFESLRWPFPGPKATHGIIKALFLVLIPVLFAVRRKLYPQKHVVQNLLMVIFVFSYVISAAFSKSLEASLLNLWYPFMALCVLYIFSRIKVTSQFLYTIIALSALLVCITFAFAFFSIMFRYSVDTLYYFIFLDHRANHLLGEIRRFGKYVSLGPYIMLTPLTAYFLVEKKADLNRKLLSLVCFGVSVLTAVISNNRIDVLIIAIQFSVLLFLLPRKTAVILLACMIPLAIFGLTVTDKYFGFNLEQRILRPKGERDLETIDMRFTYWQTALYNFKNYPLLGTGPNTYNDVSNFPLRRYYNDNTQEYTAIVDEGIGIHNVFIERLSDTGLFGFFSFVILLCYFIRKDVLAVLQKEGDDRKKYMLFSLSSWTWILYSLTDNGYGAQGFLTFFFLRGLLLHL